MKPSDDYIFRQKEPFQSVLLHLMSVIERNLEHFEMQFKWGMPYVYYKKKMFCYLYVNTKRGFVDLGFARGFKLVQNQDNLVIENRNTIRSLRYFSLEQVDNQILESVLNEAKSLYF